MNRRHDATKEHQPLKRSETVKGHPNKGLNTPHPVTGKRHRPKWMNGEE